MWLFVQLCSSWLDFNWHSAWRGPSTIAELLVSTAAEFYRFYRSFAPYPIHHNVVRTTLESCVNPQRSILREAVTLQSAHLTSKAIRLLFTLRSATSIAGDTFWIENGHARSVLKRRSASGKMAATRIRTGESPRADMMRSRGNNAPTSSRNSRWWSHAIKDEGLARN